MKKYKVEVEISETKSAYATREIEAENSFEASKIAEDLWADGDFDSELDGVDPNYSLSVNEVVCLDDEEDED